MTKRYPNGRRKRTYFVCPVDGCNVRIRRDGAQATRSVREHEASHQVPK